MCKIGSPLLSFLLCSLCTPLQTIVGFNFDIDLSEWEHTVIAEKDRFFLGIKMSDNKYHSFHGINRNGNVGTLLYVHGNALAKADYDGFIELYKKLDEKARNDLEENNVFWDRFEGKTAEVSTKVNDTYLKAHSQTDGVLSYGRMVDLMLADFYSDTDGE